MAQAEDEAREFVAQKAGCVPAAAALGWGLSSFARAGAPRKMKLMG